MEITSLQWVNVSPNNQQIFLISKNYLWGGWPAFSLRSAFSDSSQWCLYERYTEYLCIFGKYMLHWWGTKEKKRITSEISSSNTRKLCHSCYFLQWFGLWLCQIMIIDFKLTYPSGTATAHLINSFQTPQGAKLAK